MAIFWDDDRRYGINIDKITHFPKICFSKGDFFSRLLMMRAKHQKSLDKISAKGKFTSDSGLKTSINPDRPTFRRVYQLSTLQRHHNHPGVVLWNTGIYTHIPEHCTKRNKVVGVISIAQIPGIF
ncbi:MAG: hypothetical protein NTW32_01310 [Chloroflexi bacterium]|nr:hypothetical protein [Chloroflexota bacterium]